MAKRYDILGLINALTPSVREAFLASIRGITSEIQLGLVVAAIDRGDLETALNLMHLKAEFFADVTTALNAAYIQGGVDTLAALPRFRDPATGGRVTVRFNGRNPRAERLMQRQSSDLIVQILTDQRTAIRAVMVSGMEAGMGPGRAALDIVGRINSATGRREGGLIGNWGGFMPDGTMTGDMGNVQRALAELSSGDPKMMRNYLTRKARDRRFDPTVRAAIENGTKISADDASRMAGKYSDRLLRNRGERIARTELLGSLHHAQNEGLQQLVDAGKLRASQIVNVWDAAGDKDTRESHAAMDGQSRPWGQPFVSGAGNLLMFPGDTSLGAPAGEVINCRCRVQPDIDFLSDLAE